MSFQPVIPTTGYSGWKFLVRTMDTQKDAFVQSPTVARASTYFAENIARIRTAEDLVNDRRLLDVALTAFGLQDDIDSKAFIRKVLEDGTLKDGALATRLSDKRYEAFSRAFGFGDLGARTGLSGFAQDIIARYEDQKFQAAVGDKDGQLRLALNFSNAIGDILDQTTGTDSRWFAIMGNLPTRSMLETSLGLPSSFGRIDLDQQLEVFKARSKDAFGTDDVADFAKPEVQEKIVRLFLLRSEAANSSATGSGSIALQLLQAGR